MSKRAAVAHMGGPAAFLRRMIAALLLAAALPAAGVAQDAPPPPHDDVVSANPFLLLFEWFNAEWEHRVQDNVTLGLTASYFSFDDVDYTTGSVLVRFYPQERAPSGFYLGTRAGLHRVAEDNSFFDPQEETAFGLGLDVGYTWLFGSRRNFALSLGAGVTRLFTDVGDTFLPSIRLVNVGWAF